MLKTIRWCFMGLCLAFAHAYAIPTLIVDPGTRKLLGADGVDVGGTLYDVRFVDGTCVGVFSGCDSQADLPFSKSFEAVAASEALNLQVFVDSGTGRDFDSTPGLTSGCIFLALECNVYTPYEIPDLFLGFYVNAWSSRNFQLIQNENATDHGMFLIDEDFSSAANRAWAVWAPHAAEAPLPGTLACLGIGVLALVLANRRRTQARCRAQ